MLFVPPSNLCSSSGSNWDYQKDDTLLLNLKHGLEFHYENTILQKPDKQNHPLFLVLSGAGTGKSRLLDEFKTLASGLFTGDLHSRLSNAYVFKLSLENGTATGIFPDPTHHVGCRMLYHLHKSSGITWDSFRINPQNHVSPLDVLLKLASSLQIPLNKLTAIILVDGLQKLSDFGLHTWKYGDIPYQVLQCLATISNNSGCPNQPFVISCCSATISVPVNKCLSGSSQLRCYLVPPAIDGSKIVDCENDPVLKLLVEDMGGHGRAMEALFESLSKVDTTNYSVSTLMQSVCHALRDKYPDWIALNANNNFEAILKSLLIGKCYESADSKIGEFTIDQYVSFGLFKFDGSSKQLSCPFVWISALTSSVRNPLLSSVLIAESLYQQLDHIVNPELHPSPVFWSLWEYFLAHFWCLKTTVFKGITKWHDLHSGARFGSTPPPSCANEPEVNVTQLTFVMATEHCSTKSGEVLANLRTEFVTICPDDCVHHILSLTGNPSGDSFCRLKVSNENNRVVSFVQSAKNVKTPRNVEQYKAELEKAATADDFFIEYVTCNCQKIDESTLPSNRCGIVDASCFERYFGPYSGRAFYISSNFPVSINDSSRINLKSLPGIGDATAEAIICERHRYGRFLDIDDAK